MRACNQRLARIEEHEEVGIGGGETHQKQRGMKMAARWD